MGYMLSMGRMILSQHRLPSSVSLILSKLSLRTALGDSRRSSQPVELHGATDGEEFEFTVEHESVEEAGEICWVRFELLRDLFHIEELVAA
jgi:hypothetical protein